MSTRNSKRQQLGDYWLWQRAGTGTWHVCWLEPAGQRGAVTRRKSTGIVGGEAGDPPQEAIDALAVHYHENTRKPRQAKDEALIEDLMADWLKFHVSTLQAPDRYAVSVAHWIYFFEAEQRAGRLGPSVTVSDVTPELLVRFRLSRAGEGVGGHTISRDLAALRGALSWAWKNHRLESVPYIQDVPTHQRRLLVIAFLACKRLAGC